MEPTITPDLREQVEWENEMVNRGILRYREAQEAAIKGGRTHETSAGSRLLVSYVSAAAERIKDYLAGKHPAGRKRGPYAKLLDHLDAETIAYISIKSALECIGVANRAFATAATNTGMRIEDELRLRKFRALYGAYYDEIKRALANRHNKSYEYQRASIIGSFRRTKEVDADYWTTEQRAKVGTIALGLTCEVLDLVFIDRDSRRNGGGTFLRPTPECLQWVQDHNSEMEMLLPDRMPMLIPPADWTDAENGGYITPHLRLVTPLIIGNKLKVMHGRKFLDRYNAANMPAVLAGVNAMQATPWRVNKRVLGVIQEVYRQNLGTGIPRSQPYEVPPCPLGKEDRARELQEGTEKHRAFSEWKSQAAALYALEHERQAKVIGTARSLRMAQEMKDHENMWFVYRMDFRGRVYAATTGLSPQGNDVAKGLLEFSTAKPLGKRGLYWLKVSGANRYGYDKETYDARVEWIDSQRDKWIAVASDPIAYRDVWGSADKPYQFLAWCFEYADAMMVGEGYRSRLSVGLDGSCNGLQHFSAMLRDAVGGAAVNLTAGSKPADIYQSVGDVCTAKLKANRATGKPEHNAAGNWLAVFEAMGRDGMPRALPKKPTMTLVYGSTQRTCVDSISAWYHAQETDVLPRGTAFSHALYLTPIMWAGIGEVVIAARAAMSWLQKAGSAAAKANVPVQYNSVLGFPVYQRSSSTEQKRIKTELNGEIRIAIQVPTNKLDAGDMRRGVSPNFVHNADATHMIMCINAGVAEGMDSFAMIHDDFGVHACDTERWFWIIREQFVKLYTEHDLLQEFKEQMDAALPKPLDPIPEKGSLDIQEVSRSLYFFG